MPGVSNTTVPAETDWLCEHCGYVLNGLNPGGRCPECGQLTDESAQNLRKPPAWEDPAAGHIVARFLRTSAMVIFRTKPFYRSLQTRADRTWSMAFARIYWLIVSVMLAIGGYWHLDWSINLHRNLTAPMTLLFIAAIAIVIYGSFVLTTALAARLTNWEATYRGYRMPTRVVRRGLDYHAAHYLPVAIVATLTILAFHELQLRYPAKSAEWGMRYLYVLSAEVILSASYLFTTYWTAMKNMMYASR
jgi:hypothetical protein